MTSYFSSWGFWKVFLLVFSLGSSFFVFYYLNITTNAPTWVTIASITSLTFAYWTAGAEYEEQKAEKRIYTHNDRKNTCLME